MYHKVYILLKSKNKINNNHHQYLNKLKPFTFKIGYATTTM
jgi:hypothetical protein